ncbi:MAG: hypothetical protein U5J78_02565 [Parasphingorhabdus sp.]|nr:hypothetical protein [Parasphingorhabdus sp.]
MGVIKNASVTVSPGATLADSGTSCAVTCVSPAALSDREDWARLGTAASTASNASIYATKLPACLVIKFSLFTV